MKRQELRAMLEKTEDDLTPEEYEYLHNMTPEKKERIVRMVTQMACDEANRKIEENRKAKAALLPKTWTCPACRRRNRVADHGGAVYAEYGLYMQHCDHCGWVKSWGKMRSRKRQETARGE